MISGRWSTRLGWSLCQPEGGDGLLDYSNRALDLRISVEVREAKSDDLSGSLVGAGHGHYHVRGCNGIGTARRASGHVHAAGVERPSKCVTVDTVEPHIRGVGDTGL